MVSFKRVHFVNGIMLTCVRWYVTYPLSYRQVGALRQERGVSRDLATIKRWVLNRAPNRERPVWMSWRMQETYIRVRGQWRYLYRAVDRAGQTIDSLLTAQRDERAAAHF
jgi:putative transposase